LGRELIHKEPWEKKKTEEKIGEHRIMDTFYQGALQRENERANAPDPGGKPTVQFPGVKNRKKKAPPPWRYRTEYAVGKPGTTVRSEITIAGSRGGTQGKGKRKTSRSVVGEGGGLRGKGDELRSTRNRIPEDF